MLFEAVGVDRVVAVDVHNPAAYENAFRCRTEHLEARVLIAEHVVSLTGDEAPVVVSPDVGGVKRADHFRDTLAARLGCMIDTAFVEKRRSDGVVSGNRLVGEVSGRTVLVLDDLISTGTTLVRAAGACREAGAREVHAVATHGLFVGDAGSVLADPAIDTLATTDTIPPFRLRGKPAAGRHTVLRIAPLLGEAIRRLHADGSIVGLVENR
jgi:ribose-phosphate pyrophosphokinase